MGCGWYCGICNFYVGHVLKYEDLHKECKSAVSNWDAYRYWYWANRPQSPNLWPFHDYQRRAKLKKNGHHWIEQNKNVVESERNSISETLWSPTMRCTYLAVVPAFQQHTLMHVISCCYARSGNSIPDTCPWNCRASGHYKAIDRKRTRHARRHLWPPEKAKFSVEQQVFKLFLSSRSRVTFQRASDCGKMSWDATAGALKRSCSF